MSPINTNNSWKLTDYSVENLVVPEFKTPKFTYQPQPKELTLIDRESSISAVRSSKGSSSSFPSIANLLSDLSKVMDLSKNRYQTDRTNGVKILDGINSLWKELNTPPVARDYTTILKSAFELTQVGMQTSSSDSLKIAGDLFGKIAQDYSVQISRAAIIESVAKELGIEFGGFESVDMLNQINDSLGFDFGSYLPKEITSNFGSITQGIGAAYSAYEMFDNWGESSSASGAIQGASIGGYIGSVFPGVGTAIGAGVGALIGGIAGCIKTGKHPDQKARDAVRDHFKKIGLIGDDWSLTLADGSKYDIGLDGGHRYENLDGTTRNVYDVDWSNPIAGDVVGLAQPLAMILTGGNPKLKDDFAGYFTNAALSNANTLEGAKVNIGAIFAKMNISPDNIVKGLIALTENGAIKPNDLLSYVNGVKQVLS